MILTANLPVASSKVARRPRDDVRLLGQLRSEAAREAERLFDGVSGKRINAALLPGLTRHSVSRACNGCDGNPLYRLPSWFVLCRRVGVPKARLQRIIDWLQTKLDEAYGDAPDVPLREVMETEQEIDAAEDAVQMRAACGDRSALPGWLDRLIERHAYDRTVIAVVSRELWLSETK